MKLGVSPITNNIYAGRSKPSKFNPKILEWVGKKTDVTEEAIKAVFQHMYNAAEETGFYSVSIEGYGVMSFERMPKAIDSTEQHSEAEAEK